MPALQDLAVSMYLPGRTGPATLHTDAQQVNWVSAAGDHAAEAESGAFTAAIPSWYYLSGLLVQSPGAAGTVVAFGDSITDGVASAIGANHRWSNDLARRLAGLAGLALAVADAAGPLRLNPAYDSGDHLHPNDVGYQAMADAINLQILLPPRR